MSSANGRLFSTLMFLNILSAKPSFLATRYMISRSFFDSKIGFLVDLTLRQQDGVEPPGQRDPRRFHDLLSVEARLQIVVIHLPDARPMPPRALREAVIERQRHDIEADIGRALHIVMAAKD